MEHTPTLLLTDAASKDPKAYNYCDKRAKGAKTPAASYYPAPIQSFL